MLANIVLKLGNIDANFGNKMILLGSIDLKLGNIGANLGSKIVWVGIFILFVANKGIILGMFSITCVNKVIFEGNNTLSYNSSSKTSSKSITNSGKVIGLSLSSLVKGFN